MWRHMPAAGLNPAAVWLCLLLQGPSASFYNPAASPGDEGSHLPSCPSCQTLAHFPFSAYISAPDGEGQPCSSFIWGHRRPLCKNTEAFQSSAPCSLPSPPTLSAYAVTVSPRHPCPCPTARQGQDTVCTCETASLHPFHRAAYLPRPDTRVPALPPAPPTSSPLCPATLQVCILPPLWCACLWLYQCETRVPFWQSGLALGGHLLGPGANAKSLQSMAHAL